MGTMVVCVDETLQQLVGEVRSALPPTPRRPARHDYEYRRHDYEYRERHGERLCRDRCPPAAALRQSYRTMEIFSFMVRRTLLVVDDDTRTRRLTATASASL